MRSIHARFIALILAGIALAVLVVGAISILTIRAKSDADADAIMTLSCENEAQSINITLSEIQQSVNLEVTYARDELVSAQRFFDDEAYRKDYTELMRDLFVDVANHANGAVSFYFRYNAELIDSTQGFLYGRAAPGEPFEQIELTDISLYDEDDTEHVGWYYIPVHNAAPTWMAPYHNKNLGIYMISYVVPVFVDDALIGIVGMDVDFQVIIDQLGEVEPYANGYAALVDEDGTVLYHPTLAYGTPLDGTNAELPNMRELIRTDQQADELLSYSYQGVDKRLSQSALLNGMHLVLVADARALDADRDQLMARIALASLVIVVVFAALGSAMGRQALRPLRELTQAASEVAAGNLDVEIPTATTEEVGTLVDAYQSTVQRLREQVALADDLARRDALTQLLNKVAYLEAEKGLNQQILDGTAAFALVVLDVNDLKLVNDTCGHERGDDYLVLAAEGIRAAFGACPAYRMGGDEFVVLVDGAHVSQLDDMVAAIDALNERAAECRGELWERTSLARGSATFDARTDGSVSDVLSRADQLMYDHKRQTKRSYRWQPQTNRSPQVDQ